MGILTRGLLGMIVAVLQRAGYLKVSRTPLVYMLVDQNRSFEKNQSLHGLSIEHKSKSNSRIYVILMKKIQQL